MYSARKAKRGKRSAKKHKPGAPMLCHTGGGCGLGTDALYPCDDSYEKCSEVERRRRAKKKGVRGGKVCTYQFESTFEAHFKRPGRATLAQLKRVPGMRYLKKLCYEVHPPTRRRVPR